MHLAMATGRKSLLKKTLLISTVLKGIKFLLKKGVAVVWCVYSAPGMKQKSNLPHMRDDSSITFWSHLKGGSLLYSCKCSYNHYIHGLIKPLYLRLTQPPIKWEVINIPHLGHWTRALFVVTWIIGMAWMMIPSWNNLRLRYMTITYLAKG